MADTTSVCARCAGRRALIARGLCSACYQAVKRSGDLERYDRQRQTPESSLAEAKANETPEGCWPWPHVMDNGYPETITVNGQRAGAHVHLYRMAYGVIPEGLTLDHLCHSAHPSCDLGVDCPHRRCVRPGHLEPATLVEQAQRRPDYRRGSCVHGHPFTERNTLVRVERGRPVRRCRTCQRDRQRNYLRRKCGS